MYSAFNRRTAHKKHTCLLAYCYCLLYYLQVYTAHNLDLMLLRCDDGLTDLSFIPSPRTCIQSLTCTDIVLCTNPPFYSPHNTTFPTKSFLNCSLLYFVDLLHKSKCCHLKPAKGKLLVTVSKAALLTHSHACVSHNTTNKTHILTCGISSVSVVFLCSHSFFYKERVLL